MDIRGLVIRLGARKFFTYVIGFSLRASNWAAMKLLNYAIEVFDGFPFTT